MSHANPLHWSSFWDLPLRAPGRKRKKKKKKGGGGKKTKEEKPAFISKWHVKARLLPNNKESLICGNISDRR